MLYFEVGCGFFQKAAAALVDGDNTGRGAMAKKDALEYEGVIMEALPNAQFRVQLSNGHMVLAYLSGKMRTNFVRVVPGDKVRVVLSEYDLNQGRIVWRNRG